MLVLTVLLVASVRWFPAMLLLAMGVHVWRSTAATAAEQREAARAELEVVASRADVQTAQVLAGDVRGVYGEFPPKEGHRWPTFFG